MNERSLQININSMDDARAVIAHLPRVKAAYDSARCDSVEFYIAAPVMKAVENTLRGAIPWTRTFVKAMPLGEGNTYFELPHYEGACLCDRPTEVVAAHVTPALPPTAAVRNEKGEQVATARGTAATPVAPPLPAMKVEGFRAEEVTPPKPHGKSPASRQRAPSGA